MNKKSPFEIINELTLNLIYFINRIFLLGKINLNRKLILCYHSVGDSGWRFATPKNIFNNQVEFVIKNYKATSLANILTNKNGGVVFTFDDGYKDIFINAYPILEKHNIKGTIFVLSDRVKANRQELDNSLEFMSTEEIKKLQAKGWEVGCHSETHADLHSLSLKELEKEIKLSKENLEKELGFEINYFAYPKGKYNKDIVKIVKDAGYKWAFTVDGGFISFKQKMLVTRLPMEGILNIRQFSALISDLGLFVEQMFMKILQVKEKISHNLRSMYGLVKYN